MLFFTNPCCSEFLMINLTVFKEVYAYDNNKKHELDEETVKKAYQLAKQFGAKMIAALKADVLLTDMLSLQFLHLIQIYFLHVFLEVLMHVLLSKVLYPK